MDRFKAIRHFPEETDMGSSSITSGRHYEIRFQPLAAHGRTLAFPCDTEGSVDLDALCDQARNNYFFARAVAGRDYRRPTVVPVEVEAACA
jgi:hypothetical protein